MTYGENAGTIRDQLAELLCQHRIQQRIGGTGTYRVTVSTTPEEREHLGLHIQCYRFAALRWTRQALEAVRPKTDLIRENVCQLTPTEKLCRQLDRIGMAYPDGAPRLGELLDSTYQFDMVARWQQIARAAVLGEHDFTTDVNLGFLDPAQAAVVANDAANIILGLAVLDLRYEQIPGWKSIHERGALNQAATDVSRFTTPVAGGLTVDFRGWRPAPTADTGPAPAGVAGAVQAQHNLLLNLVHLPHALNLRRLLFTQTQVSQEAARHAATEAPELLERFRERQAVYQQLLTQSRNLSGVLGDGGQAVAEGQLALSRLRAAHIGEPTSAASLHHLQRLFMHTDARMASTIERGIRDKAYLVAAKVPRIGDQRIHGVYQTRQRWVPATQTQDTGLVPIVRERLRPQPIAPPVLRSASVSRRALQEALIHRPATRARHP